MTLLTELNNIQKQVDIMYGGVNCDTQKIQILALDLFKSKINELECPNIEKHLKDKYSLVFNQQIINNSENVSYDYKVVSKKIQEIKNKPERWGFYCGLGYGRAVCFVMQREA